MQVENGQGDRFELTFSQQAVASMTTYGASNQQFVEGVQGWMQKISEQMQEQAEGLLQAAMDEIEGKNANESDSLEELEAALPEYWNAENTSQRIVDFATSFHSIFSGEDESFYQEILEAVREGFRQAGLMAGDQEGAVQELWNKTEDLTFQKLDSWYNSLSNQQSPPQLSV
ncbi:hypothetical protein [Okeania sp. SIO1H5]|uniref:hypothetical protein n=1 Tax=Okeania sp. SIO1H5 TaxID=2607777 RepID=UPI00257D171A|nr:hypothetical protein [Okeania sp. SIO1H5]